PCPAPARAHGAVYITRTKIFKYWDFPEAPLAVHRRRRSAEIHPPLGSSPPHLRRAIPVRRRASAFPHRRRPRSGAATHRATTRRRGETRFRLRNGRLELEGELDGLHARPRVRGELPAPDLVLEALHHPRVLGALGGLDGGGPAVRLDDPAHDHAARTSPLLLVGPRAGAQRLTVAGNHAHDVALAEPLGCLHAAPGRRGDVGLRGVGALRAGRRRLLLREEVVDAARLPGGQEIARRRTG